MLVIAAAVGAVVGSLDTPPLDVFLNRPLEGAVYLALLTLLILSLIIVAAILDQLIHRHIAPPESG